jgi:tetratricopeptide (TPR) repeat protein
MDRFEEDFNNGLRAAEQGDLNKAIEYFSTAIHYASYTVDKKNKALAYWNRSYVYGMRGDIVDAIYDLKEVLELDPSHSNARKTLQNFYNNPPGGSGTIRDSAAKALGYYRGIY